MDSNINSIVIFKNKNKKSEKAPDYNGKLTIDGVEFEVTLWKKTSKAGLDYLSGLVKPAEEKF